MARFRHFRYRAFGHGQRELKRLFQVGTEPETIEYDGLTWRLASEPGSDTRIAVKETIDGFKSRSLPKNWPYAKRHAADGACVFHSRKEVNEAVDRANDHGENVTYDY